MKLQVAVKLLLQNSQGQYLLVQRSQPLADGTGIKWDIPGGRIEPAEKLEAAIARELSEEIGLGLTASPNLLMAQDLFIVESDLHVVRLTYTAQFEGEIGLGDEHQAYKWLTPAEGLELNIDPYLRGALENIQKLTH